MELLTARTKTGLQVCIPTKRIKTIQRVSDDKEGILYNIGRDHIGYVEILVSTKVIKDVDLP